ncbi:hypothetical protein C8R45DRAFT_1114863 [Mycena sanguinolenta]|nr:hypothetical protein C8R45DRAFT_1114863 [Mycena sanguinolenta]
MKIQILDTKEDAIKADRLDMATYKAYTDGSGIGGRIGASTVLFENRREVGTLQLLLGDDHYHTVYESEGVGGCLAMTLLFGQDELCDAVTIAVDNQAAVKAVPVCAPLLSHWIWDAWHGLVRTLSIQHLDVHVMVRWTLGACQHF